MMGNNRNHFSLSRLRACAALLAIVSLVAFAAPSGAAIINVNVDGEDFTLDSAAGDGRMTNLGEGRYFWGGTRSLGNQFLQLKWEVDFDPDPFIGLLTELQNDTGATVEIVATITDDTITEFPGAGAPMTAASGLVLNDTDFSGGATMAALAGKSIFTGLIDGADAATLFGPGYSLTAPAGVGVDSDTLAGDSPIDMTTSIGIRHEFSVTAGDKGAAISRFEVVPEPSSAALVMLGICGFGLIRRKG